MTNTSVQRTALRPKKELRYLLPARLFDGYCGKRDSASDIPGNSRQTPWQCRNAQTFAERASSERVGLDHELRPQIERLQAGVARVSELEVLIALLEESLERAQPSEGELQLRAASEHRLSDQEVRRRRQRESDGRTAGDRSRRAALQRELSDLRSECSELTGVISAGWHRLIDRVGQLEHYHSRRLHTYRSAYLRGLRRKREVSAEEQILAHDRLDRPKWADLPCPWLVPLAQTEVTSTEAAAQFEDELTVAA